MSEENGIISSLVPSQTSEQFVLNVANSPTASDQFHGENHHHDGAHLGSSNPFRFIGCDELSVPSQTTVDPFRNGTPDIGGVYEWVKILLCLPILVVRLVLLAVSLLVGYTVTRLALVGLKDRLNPMPQWRCRVMWITRFCARCILFSFGYQYIKRKGRPAPREVAPIIVSNHISYIEPIFFFYELFPTTVASVSHDSMPIVGAIIRAMQVIYVDMFSEASRKRVAKEIRCDVSLGKLIFRMLTQFHNFFEISYAMATALNVVQTKYTFGDSILHMKALEAKQDNPLNYMVEMARVESLFRISNLEAAQWLDKFLSMNPDSSGNVQYHDFLRVLKLKSYPISKEIFAFMDVEKNGTITFRQFLYGLVNVLKQPLFREACELAFVACGGLVNSFIVEQQFQDSMQTAIPGWKDNEVHELFLLFDHDKNGFVSKDDFVACLRRNPLLIAFFMPLLHHKNLLGSNEVLEII